MNEQFAIEISNLTYQYDYSKQILNNVNLRIPKGSIVTILGKNGVGKTTLLNCILGFIENYSGTITIFGKKQSDFSRKEFAQIVGLVPQLGQIFFDYTVQEFVLMGCSSSMNYFAVPDKAMYAIVEDSLNTLGIFHLKDRRVNSLSGGERQLVYIARTLSQRPKIIVLDEPTSALDYGNSMKIIGLLAKLKEDGFTIILTCHNPDYPFVFRGYTAAILPEHKVVFGKSEQILTDDVLTRLYGVNIKRIYLPETNQYVCVNSNC